MLVLGCCFAFSSSRRLMTSSAIFCRLAIASGWIGVDVWILGDCVVGGRIGRFCTLLGGFTT